MTTSENDRTVFLAPDSATKADSVARPAIPRHLGKYSLTELIGAGSFGVVYKSLDPDSKREVAVKVVPLKLWPATGPALAQFRLGIEKAMALTHPGIVPIRACGEEAGFAYIVMDWVNGRSLRERFEQKSRFSIEQVIDIQSQLLQALQYLHDRGQWHGELNAAQVLITTNGRVRIKGFGLARPSALSGAPGYIAPETYLNGAVDTRSDVFAAGAVFYGLLTGAPPFAGTPDEIRRQVCDEAPLPLSRASGQPSLRAFDALALQALARHPEERLPSATQFLESLLRAYVYGDESGDVAEETLASQAAAEATLTTLLTIARPAEPEAAPVLSSPPSPDPGAPTELIGRSRVEPAAEPVGEPAVEFVVEPAIDFVAVSAEPVATPMSEAESRSGAGWNSEQLTRIQQWLVQLLGPIAAIIVRRGTRETTDFAALIAWLAARIDSVPERERFLSDVGRMNLEPGAPVAVPSSAAIPVPEVTRRYYGVGSAVGGPPTGADIARASQLLLAHLGPIAPILTKRTAQQPGCSREQFIATLAVHLKDERERANFLAAFG